MDHGRRDGHAQGGGRQPYERLLLMTALSFAAMHGLMYAMVDSLANVYNNVNQFYMTGLMAAPMVIFEVLVMRSMYTDRKMNAAVLGVSAVALVAFWFGVREQAAVSDRQFMRSMIPHHAGAILMCGQNELEDPRLVELCSGIVSSQREEIAQLKAMLNEPAR